MTYNMNHDPHMAGASHPKVPGLENGAEVGGDPVSQTDPEPVQRLVPLSDHLTDGVQSLLLGGDLLADPLALELRRLEALHGLLVGEARPAGVVLQTARQAQDPTLQLRHRPGR